jgi:hypothetical protein
MAKVNAQFQGNIKALKALRAGLTFQTQCGSHAALRRKSKRVGIRIMHPVGQHVYLRTVVSVSEQYKNPTKRMRLVQSEPYQHLIENLTCSRHDIAEIF